MSRLTSNLRKLDSVCQLDIVVRSRFKWDRVSVAVAVLGSTSLESSLDGYIKRNGVKRMTTDPTKNRIVQKFIILMKNSHD